MKKIGYQSISLFAAYIFGFVAFLPNYSNAAGTEPIILNRGLSDEFSASLTGSYAINIGDPKMAARAFERAWAKNPSNMDVYSRALQAYMISGDIINALRLAKSAPIATRGQNADILLANEAFKDGRIDEVLTYTHENKYSDARAIYARHLQAWVLAFRGKKAAAINLINQVSGNRGLDKEVYYSRALLYQFLGENTDAKANYETAFAIGGRTSIGIVSYAEFLAQIGEKDEALDILRSLGTDFDATFWFNETYEAIKANKIPTKIDNSKIAVLQKMAARGLGIIGLAMSADTKNGSPLGEIMMASRIDNNLHILKLEAASFMVNLGLVEDAKLILQKVPVNTSFGDQASVALASLEFSKNKEKSIIILQNALKIRPNFNNRINLASFYLGSEKWQMAENIYNSLIKDSQNLSEQAIGLKKWQLLYGRSNALIGQKKHKEAIKDLREAISLEPRNPTLLNALGYILADNNQDLNEALEILEEAVARRPKSGETIDSLGWVLFRLGRYEEALDRLEDAIVYAPNVGEIAEHLGDAYWFTNRYEEARLEWKKAYNLHTNKLDKDRVKTKMTNGIPKVHIPAKIATTNN